MRFPNTTTRDLNGDLRTLPADFTGELNLILLAYQQWHQREVDSWVPLAEKLEKEYPDFRYYELPLVGNMNFIGRLSLDYWMRQGIPDKRTRARTLTLYQDRADFRQKLNIETEETIALVLLNGSGDVLWQALGPYADQTARSLSSVIEREKLNKKESQIEGDN